MALIAVLAAPLCPSRGQPPERSKAERVEPGAGAVPALALSRAPSQRQVTALAILAIPNSSELDPRLDAVQARLRKVLPGYGFKLQDVQSKRIGTGQSVNCDLGGGYRAETVLVKSLDDDGKLELRCNLAFRGTKEFSTLVRTPANQLFFYERTLREGTRVLIGVGAR
jgi:hypothetical protein